MSLRFGILAFPNIQQLDLTGPYEVFASAPDSEVHIVWKTTGPLKASTGLWITPTTTFADCPPLDVLCVPGGIGVNPLMEDEETLAFIRAQAARARYLTSVCTGSLVLGAAGLLKGRRATSHWNAVDLLAGFGARPVKDRVVRDGNLFTAGGVTSGIDFGLTIVAELYGEAVAQRIQLMIEYAPQPPFTAGTPETAPAAIVEAARAAASPARQAREAIVARAAARAGVAA